MSQSQTETVILFWGYFHSANRLDGCPVLTNSIAQHKVSVSSVTQLRKDVIYVLYIFVSEHDSRTMTVF